jgi:hypothetical protein
LRIEEVVMGMCAAHPVPLPGGAELSGHVSAHSPLTHGKYRTQSSHESHASDGR